MIDRLAELRAKDTLTTAEMNELMGTTSETFVLLPDLTDIGVIDVQKAVVNYVEGARRSRIALAAGCYIEVIALRAQHSEYWLRMFWASRNPSGKIYSPSDKRTFGVIINECIQLGFDASLGNRLRDSNSQRIDAVHKYLLGGTDYAALGDACILNQGLDGDVFEYVITSIGEVSTSATDVVGRNFVKLSAKLQAVFVPSSNSPEALP